MGLTELISKYSTSGPRYTSYPTAPQWSEAVGTREYEEALKRVGPQDSLALYVHLPFCEKLCYYCGCNIQITQDRGRSRSYVDRVREELERVASTWSTRRRITQISWGGGTPTFLSLDEIRELHETTLQFFDLEPDAEVSLEVDPRVTSFEQLGLLRELGFNRVSLGVQDFDPQVQQAVNRRQPAEHTAHLLKEARRLGFRGINFDLIYGLPYQTPTTFEATLSQVVAMRPDRIALYNYARLPSLLKHQGILESYPMPEATERVALFTRAYEKLGAAGYLAIGMDHFALDDDGLAQALRQGALYRNFMGYTVRQARHLIGVGASAIGEVGGGFFQNVKKPREYEERIAAGGHATLRGILLSEDDRQRQWVIQKLMCQFRVPAAEFRDAFGLALEEVFPSELSRLDGFRSDGILEEDDESLEVTELGRLFVRNVAMVFDAYLERQPGAYSKTV